MRQKELYAALSRLFGRLSLCVLFVMAVGCSGGGPRPGAPGRACTGHASCVSNLCVDVGGGVPLCSRLCSDETVCPDGWSCGPFGGIEGNICQCIVRAERCNGLDDDCDGIIDNRCVGDGGTTTCECQPAQSEEEQRACSGGVEVRTRVCDGCRWGAWTAWGACAAGGCAAGQRSCNGVCAACPTVDVVRTGCAENRCVAVECAAGKQPCATGCCAFDVREVDNGGLYADMALDSQGRAHIAYHTTNVGARYAAEQADGTFSLRTVEAGADFGVHSTIALDASDSPHIAYRNARLNTLRYASMSNNAFTTVQIDGTVQRGDVGWYVQAAIDSMNRPAFAYRNNKLSQLTYAFRGGTGASFTTRDTTPSAGQNVGEYPSIAFGADGAAHISHRDRSNNALVYSVYRGGSFRHEVIDTNDNPGIDSQILVLPGGDVVVGYYAYAVGEPRIARRSNGSWQVVDIATGGRDLGISLGMAADNAQNIHLCLRDSDERTLYYGRVGADGTQELRVIDSTPDRGDFCSIAVSANNQITVVYADRTRDKLMLARF